MINREASQKLIYLASHFKAVVISGPRQSGKTTLAKQVFPDKKYVSLENPDKRQFALTDPKNFLADFPNGAIIDEIQRAPELLEYLQEILDLSKEKGLFILTGSNNILLNQHVSQTLAGRVAYINLLPFSVSEIYRIEDLDLDKVLLKGFYPPIFDQNIPSEIWFPNYIRTYIERDVRQIKNITDLLIFEKFMRLLAGKVGQELNMTSLSNDVGVDVKTIQSWIGILESSYIIYLLKPFYKNYNKTLIKRPKVYFIDIGLAIALVGITQESQIKYHPQRGSFFENLVIIDAMKVKSHNLLPHSMYYWRDKTGHEVDLIIENGEMLLPIEIKSALTIANDFFINLIYWLKISKTQKGLLVYPGENQSRGNGIEVKNWKQNLFVI